MENENHLLNECDLYEANRKDTLQKISASLLTSSHSTYTSTHSHFTTSSHSENIITLFPPHYNLEDTNVKKNAHFYQTLARFITICFKRRKQLHKSLLRISFAQYYFELIISVPRTVSLSHAVPFLPAQMIHKELIYHKTFNRPICLNLSVGEMNLLIK